MDCVLERAIYVTHRDQHQRDDKRKSTYVKSMKSGVG